mgnify:CR=1 FL=1
MSLISKQESEFLINIVHSKDGELKRVGYKSMRGLIAMLKRTNKNCKKFGGKLNFTITLPIKD